MGLDMYVKGKKYLSDYNKSEKPIKDSINDLFPDKGNININVIEGEAAYWRKANAIHSWFVREIQDGVDDCRDYYLDREKIEKLIKTCETVLDDHSKAEELLPTQSGFFFGDTSYDEYYFDDLKMTIDQLKPLLEPKYINWDFYYHSSW